MFQVRIHSIDYCLAAPTAADYDASRAPLPKDRPGRPAAAADSTLRVPIIRVYGATSTGQIACAHIHGVFPYLFVPVDRDGGSDSGSNSGSLAAADRLGAALRHGIDSAVGRGAVLAVTTVRGIPFYGFHVGYRLFLKVYLLDPAQVARVAELLRQGRVAGVPPLLPHEAHIPFLLQFMTDYNLYGCDVLTARTASLRPPDSDSPDSCPMQADVAAHSICNRDSVPERGRQHTDLPEVPTSPSQRLVHSMATLWREMATKYNKTGKKSEEERRLWETVATQEAFAQLGASSSDPRATPALWRHEDEYRDQIADIIAAERRRHDTPPLRPREPMEDDLPTVRQSVEDFYPTSARPGSRKRKTPADADEDPGSWDKSLDVVEPATADVVEAVATTVAATAATAAATPTRKRPLCTAVDEFSPSPDFERQLGLLLDQHDQHDQHDPPCSTKTSSGSEWLFSSQQSEPRLSQELPSRKKPHRAKDAHRPLSQTFSVAKSAFPREEEPKLSQTTVTDRHPDSSGDGPALPWSGMTGTPDERDSVGASGPFYPVSEKAVAFARQPPAAEDVLATLGEFGPDEEHQDAFFSVEADRQKHMGQTTPLPEFSPCGRTATNPGSHAQTVPAVGGPGHPAQPQPTIRAWEIAVQPPSYATVAEWLESETRAAADTKQTAAREADARRQTLERASLSQEERAAAHQFSSSQRTPVALDMRTLCLEVHANSRGTLLPNPDRDAVQFVFWKVAGGSRGDEGDESDETDGAGGARRAHGPRSGVLSVSRRLCDGFPVDVVADERELVQRVVRLVHAWDPDVLAGFETSASSWGYLCERAALLAVDLWLALGRVPQPRVIPLHEQGQTVTGRYLLSVGRALRGLVDLRQYTLENAAWQVLGLRVPFHRPHVLTAWVGSGRARDVARVARYYRRRASLGLALLNATELVARTSEQARVLGVDFAAVLDRGSQFKVESVLLRVAKPENFVLPSPGQERVGQQNAAACTPLVLEPRSGFYSSPVVVLDFTSLYPSLMIAYNLCYSTYLGRLDPLYQEKKGGQKGGGQQDKEQPVRFDSGNDLDADLVAQHMAKAANKMGFTQYERRPGLLEQLAPLGLVVTPNGFVYAGARTRQSLLAKMLAEILETRAMVKAAMKTAAAEEGPAAAAETQRLHNRQLALKLLANVTYGYTSASFSGRMPCVEVADSIVQTGRQTLDRAMALIHSVERWRAEVVYGDTDSLFVHLPGRTRAQAFVLGAEMAAAVTAANPAPVRLKLEKVYHPCVLVAKKRYVGYAYERAEQAAPAWDAKGIETVRRDGSPASAALLEACLRRLFDSADVSQVQAFAQARFDDVLHGRLSLLDLCFAKDVHPLGTYRAPPPGAVVAARRLVQDPRAVLLPRERVPYVVVAGPPGATLRERCVAPETVVRNRQLRIDSDYYIQKSLLPPLDRIFRLMGVDVWRWYREMPRSRMPLRPVDPAPTQTQTPTAVAGAVAGAGPAAQQTLDTWLQGARCARCDQPVKRRRRRWWGPPPSRDAPVLCKRCGRDNRGTLAALQGRVRDAERAYADVLQGCRGCVGVGPQEEVRCENLTCDVYFERAERAVQARVARAKMPLVMALAERGMRDLAW